MKFNFKLGKLEDKAHGVKSKLIHRLNGKAQKNKKCFIAGGIVVVGIVGGGFILGSKNSPKNQPTSSSTGVANSYVSSIVSNEQEEDKNTLTVEIPNVAREDRPLATTIHVTGLIDRDLTFHRDLTFLYLRSEDEDPIETKAYILYGKNEITNEMIFALVDNDQVEIEEVVIDGLGQNQLNHKEIKPIIYAPIIDVVLSGALDDYGEIAITANPDSVYETEHRSYTFTVDQLYNYADNLGSQLGYDPVVRSVAHEENEKVLEK